MKTVYQLQQIADRLRAVTEVNSISPEDTFGLQADVLEYLADMEQNAEGLGIHKVYASYAAMVADASAPVGSNGKALRFGQLVVIYDSNNTTQAESGNVYAWQKGQTGASAWKLMGNLGNVHALQSQIDSLLSSDESLKGQLNELETKVFDIIGGENKIDLGQYDDRGGTIHPSTCLWVSTALSKYRHKLIRVAKGDAYKIIAIKGNINYAFFYSDKNAVLDDKADVLGDVTYTINEGESANFSAPQDCFLYIRTMYNGDERIYELYKLGDRLIYDIKEDVSDIKEKIGEKETYLNVYASSKTITNSYQNLKIEKTFEKGELLRVTVDYTGGALLSIRARIDGVTKSLYTITSGDERILEAEDNIEYFLVVPETVSINPTTYNFAIDKCLPAYGLNGDIVNLDERVKKIEDKPTGRLEQFESLLGNGGIRVVADSFSSGSSIELDSFPWYNKVGNQIAFTAKIAAFNSLKVHFGEGEYGYVYITIDSTHIHLNGDLITEESFAHGLTLDGYISLNIDALDNGKLRVKMNTLTDYLKNGGNDYYDFEKWKYASGKIKFGNIGCSFTDVVVSATNNRFSCPFWIFGASQEGFSYNRWVGQLFKMGYTNVLVNSLSGRNSLGIKNDLQRALQYGCPKYLFFALSNDGYNYSTYKARMDEAKKVADEHNIEIIFVAKAVTPSTSATLEEQLTKRNTVVNYGCRYLDYGKAVSGNPEDPTTMYPNHLDASDNWVHPVSALGARAIALRFLTDVPEVMQYRTIGYAGDMNSASGNELVGNS